MEPPSRDFLATMSDLREALVRTYVAGVLPRHRTPLGNAAGLVPLFAEARVVTVVNGGHELLPSDEFRQVVAEFFASGRVRADSVTLPAPAFLSVEEAVRPPRRPGR